MEKSKFRIITLMADILILLFSFLVMIWTKPASLRSYLPSHAPFFLGLAVIWLVVSLVNGKMHKGKIVNFTRLFTMVISSNIISTAIAALIMYILRDYEYSRKVVLGTSLLATMLELIFGALFIAYKKAKIQDYDDYEKFSKYTTPSEYDLVQETANGNSAQDDGKPEVNPRIVHAIEMECGAIMTEAILEMTGRKLSDNTAVLSTTTAFNINGLIHDSYDYIINLHKINDIRDLDKFIEAVNSKLVQKGFFFCCVETKDQRKKRILKKYPPVINYIYYSLDFIVKRVLPKSKMTRGLYFFLTGGRNSVISRAEALGRICRGGFIIRQESFIGNRLCIEAKKTGSPVPKHDYLYGPLIALPRIGKDGKMIKVYKLRTMHPYSEYIQDYVYKLHFLENGGKFRNDFRITSWGGFCRKIWLDELPMFINFFKGEMKLIGIRPLSKQYFDLYKKEVQERRIRYKPGLIPPFYVDMPANLDEIQASEMKYLDSYDKHPFVTDVMYLFKSGWNILFRYARSK